jgi:hypothetical protein
MSDLQSENSNSDRNRSSDVLHPNHADIHVRPWMLPYLPKNEGERDFVMCMSGTILTMIVSQLVFWFEWNIAGFILNCLGIAYLGSHYWIRYGVRYDFQQYQKNKLRDRDGGQTE